MPLLANASEGAKMSDQNPGDIAADDQAAARLRERRGSVVISGSDFKTMIEIARTTDVETLSAWMDAYFDREAAVRERLAELDEWQ